MLAQLLKDCGRCVGSGLTVRLKDLGRNLILTFLSLLGYFLLRLGQNMSFLLVPLFGSLDFSLHILDFLVVRV
jgi:hypothetical protein